MLHTSPAPKVRRNDTHLIVDADYLSYLIGSICQHKDEPTAITDCIYYELSDGTWVWVEPEGLVKWKIDREVYKLLDLFNTSLYSLFLTGDGNFRDDVAYSKPYKGTRSQARPALFEYVRDYLQDEYGAIMIHGKEADDACATTLCELNRRWRGGKPVPILISADKDLMMVPGWHYVPRKQALSYVTAIEGIRFFWKQMVTGDPVDNIPGIKGKGPKAKELSVLDAMHHPEDMQDLVSLMYRERHDMDRLVEQAHLLWMRRGERTDGDLTAIPGSAFQFGETPELEYQTIILEELDE